MFVGALSLLAANLAMPSTTDAAPSTRTGGAPGTYAEATRMDAATWAARQGAYLEQATAGGLDPTDPDSLIAFAERGRRDSGFDGDISSVTAADFTDFLGKDFSDDFSLSTLLTLWHQDHDLLSPSLAAAVKKRLLEWKYWWTEEPLKQNPGANYYWTENHEIVFLADEYLAGQAFPDDTFTGSGMTGRQHVAHALPLIERWISLRSRYGFSEFLSVPYTAESFMGVLSLADLAADPAVADLASKMLDVMMVEVASHLQDFALGSAKGRTYQGNLFDLRGGSTPILAELAFSTDPPRVGGNAITLATAHRYRPPEVARLIAASQDVGVVRQHQSLPLDPNAPVTNDPVAPDGLTFDDDDALLVWWGMGAQLSWQLAPLSVKTIEAYDLWQTPNFQVAGANVLEGIVKGKTPEQLRVLAQSLGKWLNPGLLSAVDTYTWRSPDAMLSTAQDWRAGQRTESALVSQATLDGAASVFVNLPKGGPDKTGWWSGDGAAPRAGQHGQTEISIYAPQYDSGGTSGPTGYQPYTHAFFPQDRFDEVVQQDGWTFARKGSGYVALWSWRPTHWAPFDASVSHPAGVTSPWELIADGGSDDVWISQVGRASDHAGSPDPFAAFRAAVTAHDPVVRPLAGATTCPASTPTSMGSCKHAVGDGFRVSYVGADGSDIGFGWAPKSADPTPPMTVDGAATSLHDAGHRWSSPWATAGRDGHYHVSIEGRTLDINLPTPKLLPHGGGSTTTTTTTTPSTAPGTTPGAPGAEPVSGDPRFTG
jgi:hypothetical protein